MKLVSINVAIKLSNTNHISRFLREEGADFVAAQEMVRHLSDGVHEMYRTKADIEQSLQDEYPYTYFGPTWVGNGFKTPTKVDRDFGGHIEQGCEVLSRYPIIGGTNEFFYKHFEYMQDWSNWTQEDHGRSLLISTVDVAGRPLQILNLHGIWTADKMGDDRTEAECKYIVEAANRHNIPTIIAGDFNLLPSSPSLQIVSKQFRNLVEEYDIKTTTPKFRNEIDEGGKVIDYIFVNDLVKVTDFKVPQLNISDHLPLILEFELK
jgi:endonuclease/exonuclease/phosphatase family metal-dependent hydrolase